MKSLKVLTLCALVGAGAFAISGCSSAQKAAAGGGLLGGAAGAVIGNNFGIGHPATGVTVGVATGTAVGGLAGDAYDQVTADDETRELENLRAELAAREAELAGLRDGAPSPDQLAELDTLRGRIAELESELGNAWGTADEEAALRKSLEDQLAALTGDRDDLAQKLNDLSTENDLLSQENDKLNEQKALLEETVRKLDNEIEELRSLLENKDGTLASLENENSTLRDELAAKTKALDSLHGEVDVLQASLNMKEGAVDELRAELDKLNVQLDETSRGLTMTIVDSLLYTAGSSQLTPDGADLLGSIAAILQERFPNRELLIEGHTDNQPIVHSGWRSNWELGAARALTILHELVGVHGLEPDNVSATSYGEFHPQATNATEEGRAQNRRAVIVILPEKLPLQRASLAQAD